MKYILLSYFLFILTSCSTHDVYTENNPDKSINYTVDMSPSVLCNMSRKDRSNFTFKLYKEHSYKKCENIWYENIWYKCIAECKDQGLGKNIGGGCGHLVAHGYKCSYKPGQPKHCNSFRTNPEIGLYKEVRENFSKYCTANGYELKKQSNKSLQSDP